jgi:MFS family permease
VMMTLAGSIFAGACLLVTAVRANGDAVFAALLIASIAVAAGECFYTTVLSPLVADLAPPSLRGRYMAVIGFGWWLGLAIAPTLGAQLLTRSPTALFLGAGALAAVAAVSSLTLERKLPGASRLTPVSPPAASGPPGAVKGTIGRR